MSYDAILFDFDGVLADTERFHFAAWREVLLPFGVDLDWETYKSRGMGRPDVVLLESLGAGPAARPKLPEKRKRFVELALAAGPLPAETVALIKSLGDMKLAVVSSSDRSEIEPLLAACGVRDRFAALVCGREAPHPKPAPDPYLMAAEMLGAHRPLIVEDSEAGLASARAAGSDYVRVKGPAETPIVVRAACAGR